MNNNIFDEIDADTNHFDDLYPGLLANRNDQYYNHDRFNNSFCVNSVTNSFSVLHLNINSMHKNGSDFIAYLSLLDLKFDIICLSETYVTDILLANDFLDDYQSYHTIRNNHGGGVAIYVKNKFSANTTVLSSLSVKLDYIESIFVKINLNNRYSIVGCCYRPPSANKEHFLNFCEQNFSNFDTNSNNIIISGDFNLCMMRASENNQIASFFDNMNSYAFTPTILNPTRFDLRSCSLIDNIFVSNCSNFTSGLLKADISDHLPVFIIYHEYFSPVISYTDTITYRLINEGTLNRLYIAMSSEDLYNYQATSIDDHLEFLHKRLIENYKNCCPIRSKTISPKDKIKPWINDELKQYMKRRENFFELFKRNLVSRQFYNYYRNLVSKKIRLARKSYYETLFMRIKNNIRKTWKVINSIISNKSKSDNRSVKMLVVDDINLNKDSDIAAAFNNHFSTIGKKINESLPNPTVSNDITTYMSTASPSNSFFFSPISSRDIESLIDTMEN